MVGPTAYRARVEQGAAARHDHSCLPTVSCFELDLDQAARLGVAHSVLNHVLDHPPQERGAARDLDIVEICLDRQLLGGDLVGAVAERGVDERLERDLVALVELAVLSTGQGEEALQQLVGVVEVHPQLGVQLVGLGRHAAGLGDRHVEGGAHHRQGRAQLM